MSGLRGSLLITCLSKIYVIIVGQVKALLRGKASQNSHCSFMPRRDSKKQQPCRKIYHNGTSVQYPTGNPPWKSFFPWEKFFPLESPSPFSHCLVPTVILKSYLRMPLKIIRIKMTAAPPKTIKDCQNGGSNSPYCPCTLWYISILFPKREYLA